jgi:hypothetical protein
MNGRFKPMSKIEKEDLLRLNKNIIKARETAADEREKTIIADVKAQIAAKFSWTDDPIFEDAFRKADTAAKEQQHRVSIRCKELGIAEKLAPRLLGPIWCERWESMLKERRKELLEVGISKAKAIAASIKTEAKKDSVNFEIKVLSNTISSEAARNILDSLPSIETLMPKLDVSELETLLDHHTHKEYVRGRGFIPVLNDNGEEPDDL